MVMCRSVYLCIYVPVYLCTCVSMYMCTYIPMYLCIYVPVYLCTCIPIYLYTYVPVYVPMYLCTCVPMYLCTCVPMYLCTCVSMYLCMGHLQVVAKRKASPTHNPLNCTNCTDQQTVQSSIWCPLSKIKTNSIQPTQTVTSALGPNVRQFNFCTGGGQREEKRLVVDSVDRCLRGVWTLHVPVRCVWWAGTALAFHSRLLSAM